jgi:UDP-N-acetylmuramyl pentapeptide synthase
MIPMTIGEIAETIGAEVHGISTDKVISEIPVIDSRLASPATFFIALAGNAFMEMILQNRQLPSEHNLPSHQEK